jgi:hypothetical protein
LLPKDVPEFAKESEHLSVPALAESEHLLLAKYVDVAFNAGDFDAVHSTLADEMPLELVNGTRMNDKREVVGRRRL